MNPRAFNSMLWGWNKIKPFWCGAGDSWLALLAPEWVGAMPVACSGALPRAELPWPPRKRFEGTPRPAVSLQSGTKLRPHSNHSVSKKEKSNMWDLISPLPFRHFYSLYFFAFKNQYTNFPIIWKLGASGALIFVLYNLILSVHNVTFFNITAPFVSYLI